MSQISPRSPRTSFLSVRFYTDGPSAPAKAPGSPLFAGTATLGGVIVLFGSRVTDSWGSSMRPGRLGGKPCASTLYIRSSKVERRCRIRDPAHFDQVLEGLRKAGIER